jgi:hypothetical protein
VPEAERLKGVLAAHDANTPIHPLILYDCAFSSYSIAFEADREAIGGIISNEKTFVSEVAVNLRKAEIVFYGNANGAADHC